MVSGATVAEAVGGLGIILVGGRIAGSGLGIVLGGKLRERLSAWTGRRAGAFLTGLGASALFSGVGELPGIAASAARARRLHADRTAMLVLGCSFGSAVAALLVLATGVGWGALAVAGMGVGIGAALYLSGSTRVAWGEALAGTGIMLFGMDILGRGLAGLARHGHLQGMHDSLPLGVPYVLAGFALGAGLRSPAAATALAIQAAAGGFIDVLSAAALLIGIGFSGPWETLRATGASTEDERCIAAPQATFAVVSALVGVLLLGWGMSSSLIESPPGGPRLSLAVFATISSTVAALAVVPALDALLRLVRETGSSTISAATLDPGLRHIPALAEDALAGALDETAGVARELARKVLGNQGPTEFRWKEARGDLARAVTIVDEFLDDLEGTRWPTSTLARALGARDGVRAWHALGKELGPLRHRPGLVEDDPLAFRFQQSRFALAHLIQGCANATGTEELDGLTGQQQTISTGLDTLRSQVVGSCVHGLVGWELLDGLLDRVAALRRVSRLALEGARARVELASGATILYEAEVLPPGAKVDGDLSDERLDQVPAHLPGRAVSNQQLARR